MASGLDKYKQVIGNIIIAFNLFLIIALNTFQ